MDDVKYSLLTGVKIGGRQLGRGAYGRVSEVDYNGTRFAAKEMGIKRLKQLEQFKQLFLSECLLHSKLDHPNIVKMLGVYYPSAKDVKQKRGWKMQDVPILVMELMEYNLTTLLRESQDVPMYIKLSLLQDVSRGIHYLHTLNPPVMHRDLSSNNILLNNNLVAKISDFKVAKVLSFKSSEEIILELIGSSFFMPEDAYNPRHGLSLDVFSFGCVVCHVISQYKQFSEIPFTHKQIKFPQPCMNRHKNAFPFKPPAPASQSMQVQVARPLSKEIEIDKRQEYINQISDGSLNLLVRSCLYNNPGRRPRISQVCGSITSIIAGELTSLYYSCV